MKTQRFAQMRAAYIEAIRTAHPDVNPLVDTTRAAAAINAAYEALVQVRCAGVCLRSYALEKQMSFALVCMFNKMDAWHS